MNEVRESSQTSSEAQQHVGRSAGIPVPAYMLLQTLQTIGPGLSLPEGVQSALLRLTKVTKQCSRAVLLWFLGASLPYIHVTQKRNELWSQRTYSGWQQALPVDDVQPPRDIYMIMIREIAALHLKELHPLLESQPLHCHHKARDGGRGHRFLGEAAQATPVQR